MSQEVSLLCNSLIFFFHFSFSWSYALVGILYYFNTGANLFIPGSYLKKNWSSSVFLVNPVNGKGIQFVVDLSISRRTVCSVYSLLTELFLLSFFNGRLLGEEIRTNHFGQKTWFKSNHLTQNFILFLMTTISEHFLLLLLVFHLFILFLSFGLLN